jgi:hypothetical protein
VPLQRLLVVANRVKDVDLGIVERNHNVLLGQMQARHYALVWCDLARIAHTAVAPRRLDHVALLEMRPICHGLYCSL